MEQLAYGHCGACACAQEEIKHEMEANKVFIQGLDKKGRAVMVLLAARHSMR